MAQWMEMLLCSVQIQHAVFVSLIGNFRSRQNRFYTILVLLAVSICKSKHLLKKKNQNCDVIKQNDVQAQKLGNFLLSMYEPTCTGLEASTWSG